MGGIHALHHVFGWEGGPGVAARSVGVTATNMAGGVKRDIARAAIEDV